MAHQHLALQLTHEFHSNGTCDHQRRCSERQAYAGDCVDGHGDNCEDSKIDSTEGSDTGGDLLDIVAGGLALANAGDHTAVILDVLCNLNGIEGNLRITAV